MLFEELPKPFVIADVGSNWRISDSEDECLNYAVNCIKAAKDSDCDAVKFQMFTFEELYGEPGINKWGLPRHLIPILKSASDEIGIEFMTTAFSEDGYRYLDPYVQIHKIASCEVGHPGIIDTVKSLKKPIIYSTGMCTWDEIDELKSRFQRHTTWTKALLCVAKYPADTLDYNIKHVMYLSLGGVSDHTVSGTPSIMARAMYPDRAQIFERHFCLDHNNTPDDPHSLNAIEMKAFVHVLRNAKFTENPDQELRHTARRRLTASGYYRIKPY